MEPSKQQTIEILAERIAQEVRPDEMESIREASRHQGAAEAGHDLLSFGSAQAMVLLFDVTKAALATLSLEFLKVVGSEAAKRITQRWFSPSVLGSQEYSKDLRPLLAHYEAALRKHGFNRDEAIRAADCLSRQLLENPQMLKALIAR